MQMYTNNTATKSGVSVSGLSVLVQALAGGTATIYSDNGITPIANPMTTDGNGNFSFYAANGHYKLTISGSNILTTTVADILLNDPRSSNLEVPSGAINGSNVSFTLANIPNPSSSCIGYIKQGGVGAYLPVIQPIDFTISGNAITMNLAPSVGSDLNFTYSY